MRIVTIASLFICLFTSLAFAGDISVVSTGGNNAIGNAFISATTGDVLVLADAGPYVEDATFVWDKPISLRAASGVDPVINSSVPGHFISLADVDGVKIGDNAYGTITLSHSTASTAAVSTNGLGLTKVVTFENLVFEGGAGEYSTGYFYAGNVNVNNCTFNGSGTSSYALQITNVNNHCVAALTDCVFRDGVYSIRTRNGVTLNMIGCRVFDNSNTAIYADPGADVNTININTTIFSNTRLYDMRIRSAANITLNRAVFSAPYSVIISDTGGVTLTADYCDFLGFNFGIRQQADADITATNSVLAAQQSLTYTSGAGSFVSDYNCAWGGASGDGYTGVTPGEHDMADTDPGYANPPLYWDSGDSSNANRLDLSSMVWPDDLIPSGAAATGADSGGAVGSALAGASPVSDWDNY